MKNAPEAKVDDGLLDLVVLKKISRLRILQIFKTIFTGAHVREPEVDYEQARKITIDTEEPRVLNVDGEVLVQELPLGANTGLDVIAYTPKMYKDHSGIQRAPSAPGRRYRVSRSGRPVPAVRLSEDAAGKR